MANQSGVDLSELVLQLAPVVVVAVLLVVPFVRILHRAGRSGWWVLLLLVPGLGWVILPWVIAFMRWERPRGDLGDVFR